MDDHLRKQIEEVLRHVDERPPHTTEEDQGRIVHVYILGEGGYHGGGDPGRPCATALFPLPRKVVTLLGWCLFLTCIALLLSLFPIITITTTTVTLASTTIITQQTTLNPSGVTLLIGGLALLVKLFNFERKETAHA
ncbi:hypothetical protein [Dictyobacter kobayashii]|uniref:Uncharacterized protein n=1 Tax=Dictyobacter kobayashii TaxID=2014872 RepID=A0A402AK89_9CHLR|nr:hypothetical protein [Dictyobacter kobayashii]GCE19541.1 hypothetical protein KDK_33410 [Dictyobacter kobayashii]